MKITFTLDLTVEELIATLMTPTEQKFYPIELFAPTALKSSNPNEGPGAGMDIRNSFGDVFTHIHRQTYGHIDPLGTDKKNKKPEPPESLARRFLYLMKV